MSMSKRTRKLPAGQPFLSPETLVDDHTRHLCAQLHYSETEVIHGLVGYIRTVARIYAKKLPEEAILKE
ncbi:MAG: hypothetical protein KF726_10250 [Anaerolineae bacterium]|nr:hypothetical protein [Anaerolineae bacterium]